MSEDDRRGTDETTMADVSHTHPHTGETFGDVYRRGPAVADGGRDDAPDANANESTNTNTGAETMCDVDHTPPHGEGANDVWARGRKTGADADAEDVRDGGDADE